MTDRIRNAFLTHELEDGLALAQQSDLLQLVPLGQPADRFLAFFNCRGLVQRTPGEIEESDHFQVGIWFPADYLRTADPFRVLTWMGPRNTWHPNISADFAAICIGRLAPGTGLVDILYQVFEVITWNKVNMREDDALNKAACEWARRNATRYPVDRRPLKRPASQRRIDHDGGTNRDGLA